PKRRRLQIRRIMQRIQLLESDLRIPTTLLSQHPRNRWQILAWPPINPIPTLIVTGPVLQHCLALGPVCPGFPTGFSLTKPIELTSRVTMPECTQRDQALSTTQLVRTRHHTITPNTRSIIITNRSLARLVTGYIHVIIMGAPDLVTIKPDVHQRLLSAMFIRLNPSIPSVIVALAVCKCMCCSICSRPRNAVANF